MWVDEVIQTIPAWLNGLKTQPGVYKMSENAFKTAAIDATSLALDLKSMLGLPIEDKEDSVFYMNNQQEPSTGFYHEEFHEEFLDLNQPRILEMSGTYFGYQVGSILYGLGERPKYRFAFYDTFLKEGMMTNYMENIMPWDIAPMGAGNMVDHGATMMKINIGTFEQEEYKNVLDEMYEWLSKNQDEETGLWGNLKAQGKNGIIQAGYHLMRGTYFDDRKTFQYPDRIIDTTLSNLQEMDIFSNGNGEGCHDMDHFVLLERCLNVSDGYRIEEAKLVAEKRLEDLVSQKKPDGGFSFEAKGAITNHNRYDVSAGLSESDLVGTVFYLETIYRIYKILNIKPTWNSSLSHGIKEP